MRPDQTEGIDAARRYCCEQFAAEAGDMIRPDDDGTWTIGGDCAISGVRFCPFCGAALGVDGG